MWQKKNSMYVCVCVLCICVCVPPHRCEWLFHFVILLLGWHCRIAIADFAPYLLLSSHNLLLIVKADTSILPLPFFVLIRINQTRAFLFHHKLRFADTSFPLLLIIQKSRHEHSSLEIIWDLNCWQDWFLRFLTFIGERTVAIAEFVIVLISLLILIFCRHEHSYLLIFLLIRDFADTSFLLFSLGEIWTVLCSSFSSKIDLQTRAFFHCCSMENELLTGLILWIFVRILIFLQER